MKITPQLKTGTKVRQLTSVILTPRLKLSEELYFITTVAQSRPTHTIISKHCTREFIWNGKRLHGMALPWLRKAML